MSTFPGVVRFAFLRVKKEHPQWDAAVARPRVAKRLSIPEEELPCLSTIEKYRAQYRGTYSTSATMPARSRLAVSSTQPTSGMIAKSKMRRNTPLPVGDCVTGFKQTRRRAWSTRLVLNHPQAVSLFG